MFWDCSRTNLDTDMDKTLSVFVPDGLPLRLEALAARGSAF